MRLPSQDELERRLTEAHDAVEAAARQGQAWLLEVFHHPPRGISMHEIDLEHRIQRVNPEELRILGYAEGDMDRLLKDEQGKVVGIRTAMLEIPAGA